MIQQHWGRGSNLTMPLFFMLFSVLIRRDTDRIFSSTTKNKYLKIINIALISKTIKI